MDNLGRLLEPKKDINIMFSYFKLKMFVLLERQIKLNHLPMEEEGVPDFSLVLETSVSCTPHIFFQSYHPSYIRLICCTVLSSLTQIQEPNKQFLIGSYKDFVLAALLY